MRKQGRIGLRRDRRIDTLLLLPLEIAAVGSCPLSMQSTCVQRWMTTCCQQVSSTNGAAVEGNAQTPPPFLNERCLHDADITLCKPLPGIEHFVQRDQHTQPVTGHNLYMSVPGPSTRHPMRRSDHWAFSSISLAWACFPEAMPARSSVQ